MAVIFCQHFKYIIPLSSVPLFLIEKQCLWFSSVFNTSRWFSWCLSFMKDPLELIPWCLWNISSVTAFEPLFYLLSSGNLNICLLDLYLNPICLSCTFLYIPSFFFSCLSSGYFLFTCFLVHLVSSLLLWASILLLIHVVFF